MLDPQVRLRPNEPQVLAETVDDQVIIINQATDVYYRLDCVGGVIFSMLGQSYTLEDIAQALADSFAVPLRQVQDDVRRLAEQLLLEKILVPADGVPPPAEPPAIPRQKQAYESPKLNLYRMSVHACLQPNEPEVAATVIDGEAIIINVLTGVYYSLDGVGALIWSLIAAGCRNQQIIDRLVELFGISPQQAREDLEALLSQMMAEGIVRSTTGPRELTAPPMDNPPQTYNTPELNIYRDMEDLLALDPPLPDTTDTIEVVKDMHIGEVNWTKPE